MLPDVVNAESDPSLNEVPVAEAFEQVAEQITEQQSLPGIIPPFNFERCYLELEEKAAEVDALHREYEDAAREARDAKKAWDKAAEIFTAMALRFRQARREKTERAADEPWARSGREDARSRNA